MVVQLSMPSHRKNRGEQIKALNDVQYPNGNCGVVLPMYLLTFLRFFPLNLARINIYQNIENVNNTRQSCVSDTLGVKIASAENFK